MYGINRDLRRLAEEGKRIHAAILGAGQMGTDVVSQISRMHALEPVVVADLDVERALGAFRIAGYPEERVVCTDEEPAARRAIQSRGYVATSESLLAPVLSEVDAVVDATGDPEAGARIALKCIEHRKHIIMMNVEADVTIGLLLSRMASQAGIVYTLAAGDEPAAIMELYDFCDALGLGIVAAGKGKNNPLKPEATPEDLDEEARGRGLNPRMLVEFVDGSKTMIEMCSVANATGLVPDVPGMHGPNASVASLTDVFSPHSQGGILGRSGVVDYALGDVAPGVFVVATTEHPRLRECLELRDMGEGPNYLLYRPYHLCSMEVPLSIALAVLYGKSTMAPRKRPVAEVTTVAKRDLEKGEVLDGFGGYTFRCSIHTFEEARTINALPAGIARGARLVESVKRGEVITYDSVDVDEDQIVFALRKLQDMLLEDRS